MEDNHATDEGDEVSRDQNAPTMGSGKTPNIWERRGKAKMKKFIPKIKCFLCDSPHWAWDYPKKKAFNGMIEERE